MAIEHNIQSALTWLRRMVVVVASVWTTLTVAATDDHTRFLDLSLGTAPLELADQLAAKGLHREDSLLLSGRVVGLNVWFTIVGSTADSSRVNHLMLSTRHLQGRSIRDDYRTLMKWMEHRYGVPQWQSTVRGHAFARWYVGYDHDIVMVATAKNAIEIWFYNGHEKRNIDYYAILKRCERYPSPDAPGLTAAENVTWKRNALPQKTVKGSKKAKRGKAAKVRKAAAHRVKGKSKRRGSGR